MHFIFRMCDKVTVIRIKQLPHQRGGDLCVGQQSTDIVYFNRRSISDIDTICIFIESHMKNYFKVDDKQRGHRNVTLFDALSTGISSGRASLKPTLSFILLWRDRIKPSNFSGQSNFNKICQRFDLFTVSNAFDELM